MQGSTLRRTAGGLAAATLLALPTAAAARPVPGDPPQVRSAALLGELPEEVQAPVTHAGSGGSAFHWDDAAIGAAGTLALAAAGIAATGATRRRRTGGPVLG
jgi:hypothetical protein